MTEDKGRIQESGKEEYRRREDDRQEEEEECRRRLKIFLVAVT